MVKAETQATKLARIEAHSEVRFDRIEEKLDKLGRSNDFYCSCRGETCYFEW